MKVKHIRLTTLAPLKGLRRPIGRLAGALLALETNLQPTMGLAAILKGIVASIIGGIGSIPGAILGGLLLGVAENVGIWKINSAWKDTISFLILVGFLLARPSGILGVRVERMRV